MERYDDSVRLSIEVADSGIGIRSENLTKIFDPFIQADASTTRSYGGTGLGLTICNRLAELMGGKIRVESTDQKFGHIVIEAEDGPQALQKWETERFDIILMDIQMPVMSGIEVTEAIRDKEKETGEHVPIIALMARAMREEQEAISGRGFDGYLSKPFDIDRLFDEIEKCLLDVSPPDNRMIAPPPSSPIRNEHGRL